jgi:tetratricopeptide (TPR) repeat protein
VVKTNIISTQARFTLTVIGALLCFLSLTSVGNSQTKPQATSPSNLAADARYAELRTRGFNLLYNLDYDGARTHFKELQRLYPEHPAGAQFLAACLVVETLNRSRRLQTSLYNDDDFYIGEEDKPDPALVREFRALTKQAETLAAARVKANPKDAEAHYFLGAAKALRAAFGVGVERRFTAALGDGRGAVEAHRDAVKLDPTFTDAELTIGMYDYVIGDLPLFIKATASLVGFRGSKRRGLATLERVVKEGKWAQDDARVLLVALYRREGRAADAVPLARQLAARYERNYVFQLELADALIAQAATEKIGNTTDAAAHEREAFAIFDKLLAATPNVRRGGRANTSPAMPLDLVRFKYAEALSAGARHAEAATEFARVANLQSAESSLATHAALRAAQSLDLAEKRDEAIAMYKSVLARPNVYGAHSRAERGLRQPFKNERKTKSDPDKVESK